MKCLAVDDEPLALAIIEGFCNKVGYLELVAKCSNAIDAMELIKNNTIDLLFLDINIPHLTGIDFVKMSSDLPMVIFTTAYADYALTGYDLNVVDYLLKPFSFDRFFKAVSKAYDLYSLKKVHTGNPEVDANSGKMNDFIMIKVEYSTVKVRIKDILFIEGLKDYIKIATISKNYITKSSMKNVEEKLPSDNFKRIHKSFIANLDWVDSFENNHLVIGNHKLPLGSNYRENFMEFLERNRL